MVSQSVVAFALAIALHPCVPLWILDSRQGMSQTLADSNTLDDNRALVAGLEAIKHSRELRGYINRRDLPADVRNVILTCSLGPIPDSRLRTGVAELTKKGVRVPGSAEENCRRRNQVSHDLRTFDPGIVARLEPFPPDLFPRPGDDLIPTEEYFRWRERRNVVFHLALPGYSSDRKSAVIYSHVDFGGEHGPAYCIVVLRRKGAGWQLVDSSIISYV